MRTTHEVRKRERKREREKKKGINIVKYAILSTRKREMVRYAFQRCNCIVIHSQALAYIQFSAGLLNFS